LALFDIDDPDAQVGYRNLKPAEFPQEQAIKKGLEELWLRYEPYADTDFCKAFSRRPDERFWEMYLAMPLLDRRRRLRRREELTADQRNTGPDLCVRKGRRRIWIEAVSPQPGDEMNLDQIPDLFPANADQGRFAERYQIELRITAALRRKAKKVRALSQKRNNRPEGLLRCCRLRRPIFASSSRRRTAPCRNCRISVRRGICGP
jgi:hypothetical protein